MKSSLLEKTIARKDIYNGKVVKLHVDDIMLPDGTASKREVVDHCKGVCVLAVDSEDKIYLVEQYRYPVSSQILELPAGKVEEGEDMFECALRELSEETGVSGSDYELLGSFYVSPGFTDEEIYMYFCRVDDKKDSHPDEGEFIYTQRYSAEKIFEMIENGDIKDGKTIMAMYIASSRKLI